MSDPALSAKARSFEEEALPHLDTLYRVAHRYAGDHALAEDLVQDTLLKAYRAWASFTRGTNARGWLLTILRNTFINDYRRRQRAPIAVDVEAVEPYALDRDPEQTDPEGSFFARIVDAQVVHAIDALAPDFREVLVLSDVEGLNYAEIAEVLGVPVGTVKSRLFRARRQLRVALYDYALEEGYVNPREMP